jgi:hypothetical protein
MSEEQVEPLEPNPKKRRARTVAGVNKENGEKFSKLINAKRKAEQKVLVAAGYTMDGRDKITVEGSRSRLAIALVNTGCKPEEILCQIAANEENQPETRIKACIAILNKFIPDLKSVDLQADIKASVNVVVKSYLDVIEAAKPVTDVEEE